MKKLFVLIVMACFAKFAFANKVDYNYEVHGDIVLGSANAPITIIDYSSFTCPTCALFHNDVLPALESKYIDKGSVKLIFRSYAMRALDLKASTIPLCAPKDKFYPYVNTLFKTQNNWANESSNPTGTLENIARLGGLSSEQIKACFDNKALEDQIIQIRYVAQNDLQINATPTLIINGTKHQGFMNQKKLFEIIDKILKNQ